MRAFLANEVSVALLHVLDRVTENEDNGEIIGGEFEESGGGGSGV